MTVSCVGLLAFAMLWLQGELRLEPCPLCVIQRIAFILVGVTAAVATMIGPTRRWAVRLFSALTGLFSLGGLVVALRHVWLNHFPDAFGCGISPEERILHSLPLERWWPRMFEVNAGCTDATWNFLALSIADWAALWFAGFLLLSSWLFFRRR